MIEILNGLVSDISPFYLSVSMLVTIVCSYQILSIDAQGITLNNNVFTREYHALKVRLLPMQEQFGEIAEVHDWITKKTERIASPDDDVDNQSFSFLNLQIRGGQQWRKNLYSLSLKNIVL